METLDAASMRVLNTSTLLKMIWRDVEISRADISQRTGMSRSTVSTIVADLIRRGLVTELGTGHSNGGRRPVILSFNEDAYSILGFEVGWHGLRVALTHLRGGVRHWWQEPFAVWDDPERCLQIILRFIEHSRSQCAREGKPLIGVGIAWPGPLHDEVLPKWQGQPLPSLLRERIPEPFVCDKVANLGALTERWWNENEADDAGNIAYIDSQGQVGLMFHGLLHHGRHGLAGNMLRAAGTRLPLGRESIKALVHNLLSLLDLDRVVLDPDLLGHDHEALASLRAEILLPMRELMRQPPDIAFSSHGRQQIAIGAATQILGQALDNFGLFPAPPSPSEEWTWNRGSSPGV